MYDVRKGLSQPESTLDALAVIRRARVAVAVACTVPAIVHAQTAAPECYERIFLRATRVGGGVLV